MAVLGAPAITPASLDDDTDLPRGAMVCLKCGVSWNRFTEGAGCWNCPAPGLTTSAAAALCARG